MKTAQSFGTTSMFRLPIKGKAYGKSSIRAAFIFDKQGKAEWPLSLPSRRAPVKQKRR